MSAACRYVHAADGTRLAYRESGEGPPIILVNGLSTSAFSWRRLEPRWARGHRVVFWDYKGHGGSEPAYTDAGCTIPALVDDLARVMDAVGISRAVLVGYSMGCQVMFEAWRHMPERIAGLACLLGPAGRLFDTALRPVAGPVLERLLRLPKGLLPPTFGVAHRMARLPGSKTVARMLSVYGQAPGVDIDNYLEHFRRLHPPTISRIALSGGEHDARDLLPSIRVPTLVATGDRDIFAPSSTVGLPIHAAIPGARLLRIADGTHLGMIEHADVIGHAVEELLAEIYGDAVDSPTSA